ncbi:uncharacterized protein G2W53_009842 [Senna tora]|uniref:Uncharacterized protein n=1 Tax=Senna tora TaxID=362788 RepID=A0A834WYV5_9FABA|nr:uncharacterized protein G2W53_009842 [Senna tora]
MLRLESSWHGRTVDHVLTYFGRQIAVGSEKPSRITRQKTCYASESNTWVRVVFANGSGFKAPIGVVSACEDRGSCLNIFRTTNRGRISETFTNYEAKDLLRKKLHELRGKTLVAQVSQTRRFANGSGFDAPIGVVLAWEERGSCLNIFRTTNHGQISETFMNYEAKDLLRKSVDHVLTYSERQITVRSQKHSRITRQKTCCASESNTSVRVVFANRSGFDAPIGVVLAWEELSQTRRFALYSQTVVVLMLQLESSCHGRSVDYVLTYSGRQIAVRSQKPSRITRQKTCCASESNTSVRVVFANRSGFDAPIESSWHGKSVDHVLTYFGRQIASGFDPPIGVVLAWEERGSCPNIFRTTNRGRISETFTNYEAKDLLRKSQKPSRITRQKTCCASESNTSVRVVFENGSGFDAPIGVVLAWEERGSCLNIFRMTNNGRISETFTNYEAKDLLRNESNTSVRVVIANGSGFDAPIGVFLAWEERGSCLNILQMTNRGLISETFTNDEAKDLLRNESNTSVRVVFANRSGFDTPIGVVLAREERGSCLNIFRMKNRSRISETFSNYEAKDLLRKSVDHVSKYSGRQIAVRSRKPSRITRQKTYCASESNTSVRVEFANGSGFDALIGVVSAWEERGSCLNKFRMTNRSRISETFTNYEAKELLRKRSVDHVLTYSDRKITVGFQKPSRIMRQKTCCSSESNTLVRVAFANRSGFDVPIRVVLVWEERGSCLNIFWTTNCCRISETFTNYEAKDLLRK